MAQRHVYYRLYGTLDPQRVYMLAGSRWPYHAVSEQHSRRCGVRTAEQLPRWAAFAQRGVAYPFHFIGLGRLLALLAQETKQKTRREKEEHDGVTLLVSSL